MQQRQRDVISKRARVPPHRGSLLQLPGDAGSIVRVAPAEGREAVLGPELGGVDDGVVVHLCRQHQQGGVGRTEEVGGVQGAHSPVAVLHGTLHGWSHGVRINFLYVEGQSFNRIPGGRTLWQGMCRRERGGVVLEQSLGVCRCAATRSMLPLEPCGS